MATTFPTTSLSNRWIDAVQAGDASLVRQMLAMGAHPFDTLERTGLPGELDPSGHPVTPPAHRVFDAPVQRATLWQWALNAPTTEALEAMLPAINTTLRRAQPNGKAWVLDAWRTDRWGFGTLFAGGPRPERLRWLVDQTETWLLGASGPWDPRQPAPWAAPGEWCEVPNNGDRLHHPMARFQQHAVLMAMVAAGNDAAWAVPEVHRWWGDEGLNDWIDAGENRAQQMLGLAMDSGAFVLAAALVRTGAFDEQRTYAMGRVARLLYAPIGVRDEPEDDHDKGLPALLTALLDTDTPLTGQAPGIAWVNGLRPDSPERLEVEHWPVVRIGPGQDLPADRTEFKTRTPVPEVLHRWFGLQARVRNAHPEENGPRTRVAGIAMEDYEPLRQRWEAFQLRAAMDAPDLPAPRHVARARL